MRKCGNALKKRRSRLEMAIARTEVLDKRGRGAASARRCAARRKPRAPSAINAGISTFSRKESITASEISSSQPLMARPRTCAVCAESRAVSGMRSTSESEASLSESLIRSASSPRSSSSESERRRKLAIDAAASTTSSVSAAKASVLTAHTGIDASIPKSAGSATQQISTHPAPNIKKPYRHMRP